MLSEMIVEFESQFVFKNAVVKHYWNRADPVNKRCSFEKMLDPKILSEILVNSKLPADPYI